MGGMGGPAGPICGDAGAVAVTGGGAAAEDPAPGSGAVAGEAGGAWVTDGTGSGRIGVGSLPAFSLGASTLAVLALLSPDGFSDFRAGFAASLAGLSSCSLDASGLLVSTLAESVAGVSGLAASRAAS